MCVSLAAPPLGVGEGMEQLELFPNLGVDIVDVDGIVDETNNVQYIGKAAKQKDGTWRCLANVAGSLCYVQVKVTIGQTKTGLDHP